MTFPKRLTDLLGIDLPIIQAPMAGAATPELAAAVCNAGGMGSLGVAMMTAAQLRENVGKLRAQTNKPFNLNYFVHEEPKLDGFDAAPMRDALAKHYEKFGLGAVPAPASPAPAFNDEALALLLELSPKVDYQAKTRSARSKHAASLCWVARRQQRKPARWNMAARMRLWPKAMKRVDIAARFSIMSISVPSAPWRWCRR